MTTKTRENERRDYGIIIILILLLGFICIILASGWAIRFAPSWKLNTNMGSNLDPNSDFITSQPVSLIEPVDSAILTQPAWINIFLTPGVSLATRTPLPTGTATLIPVNTSTLQATITSTVAANPTNTLIYIPPAPTKTPKPPSPPTPTNTPITSLISADLRITKTDGVTTYSPGNILTYTVTVINNGPNAVTGAVITDNKPAQIATWDWVCTSQTGGAAGCTAVVGSSADFADAVNLPVGASVVYTVTANVSGTATGNLTNIANVAVPVGYTDPISGNNSATDTDTFMSPSADLQITNTDNATNYDANISVQYIIVVSNPTGPNAVTGAKVTDTFSTDLMNVTWTCAGTGGASCTAGGSVSINDSAVNLPVGSSVQYTVTATVIAAPSGPSLVNTAMVSPPAGITDPVSGNNSATDTDQLIAANPFPSQLTTSGDGSILNMSAGSFLDLQLASPLTLAPASYVVYYPDPAGAPPALQMDAVILQMGDGKNWYTILNWGDGAPNANTDIPVFPINSTDCTLEPDNCLIDTALLTNSPGITIYVGAFLPAGNYPYIRIISPSNPPDTSNDGVSIDAITVFP